MVFILMLVFFCALGMRHTFGAFPLSTVPVLLILLINGLVSWEKKYQQGIYNHILEVLKIIFFKNHFFL